MAKWDEEWDTGQTPQGLKGKPYAVQVYLLMQELDCCFGCDWNADAYGNLRFFLGGRSTFARPAENFAIQSVNPDDGLVICAPTVTILMRRTLRFLRAWKEIEAIGGLKWDE